MAKILRRLLDLRLPRGRSAFLWGPRRVGKSYWIREHHGAAPIVDLLQSDVFAEYASRPALLRERFAGRKHPLVVIDEIQKVPALLDEVHWLIDKDSQSFLLKG
jgi:predicted AAA+ superfamily ATPase